MLGIGFGGFVDGIVLHQLLQWHHLLSNTAEHPATSLRGLESNTVADGLFHVATWTAAVIGVAVLWRVIRSGEVRGRGPSLCGAALAGWGIFNLVEGTINHHILRIHHVRDDVANSAPWDLAFLASGVFLLVIGTALARWRGGTASI